MPQHRMFLIGLAAMLFAGCAAKPESIRAAYVSEMTYQPYTCEQLGQEQMRVVQALSTASDAQRRARSNDTVGVIFLGLPVSSLSGSNAAEEIGRLKGELEALQRVGIQKDCNLPVAEDPTAEPEKPKRKRG